MWASLVRSYSLLMDPPLRVMRWAMMTNSALIRLDALGKVF